MGNKAGGRLLNDVGRPIDLKKTTQLLGKIDSIFSGQKLHYILLRTETAVAVYANPAWAELDLSQADCSYIFSKLRMTARQFASTLNEAATAGIHMKGDGNIFSYYGLGDFCLILHRSIDNMKAVAAAEGALSASPSSGGIASSSANPANLSTVASSMTNTSIRTTPGASGGAADSSSASGPGGGASSTSSASATLASASSALPSPTLLCNDGSYDLEKEQQLLHVMKQLFELLNPADTAMGNGTPSSSSSSGSGRSPGVVPARSFTGGPSSSAGSSSSTTGNNSDASSSGSSFVTVKVSAASSPAASRTPHHSSHDS